MSQPLIPCCQDHSILFASVQRRWNHLDVVPTIKPRAVLCPQRDHVVWFPLYRRLIVTQFAQHISLFSNEFVPFCVGRCSCESLHSGISNAKLFCFTFWCCSPCLVKLPATGSICPVIGLSICHKIICLLIVRRGPQLLGSCTGQFRQGTIGSQGISTKTSHGALAVLSLHTPL